MHGTHLKPSAKSEFTLQIVSRKENMAERLTRLPLLRSYLALGLQHDLNPIPSGGSEVNVSRTVDPINTCQLHPTPSSPTIDDVRSYVSEGPTVRSALPKGFGRIVRDSSGNVVRVELRNDEEAGHAMKQELVIDPPAVTMESDLQIWAQGHPETRRGAGSEGMEDTIVQGQLSICAGRSF
jgi:nucleolar protein 16